METPLKFNSAIITQEPLGEVYLLGHFPKSLVKIQMDGQKSVSAHTMTMSITKVWIIIA
ncbi:MAG: hypothetical protein PHW18_04100 [Sulfuricurvum sp.]|uniref:hypothetical protein n=1 Tax=Sulfuricurvum sp. TaxID=2025608 RepID=UPI00261BD4FC|nr:hypothetical protein [Sulfuricurvum sp.]MDD2828735.1 hypothetical protein [Sulfuricurvum sp.]MDD4949313.1 hypothetical protein [Sulfuricurvum sp.]